MNKQSNNGKTARLNKHAIKVICIILLAFVLSFAILLETPTLAEYISNFTATAGSFSAAKFDVRLEPISDLRTYGYGTNRYAKYINIKVTSNSEVAMTATLQVEFDEAPPSYVDLYVDRNYQIIECDGSQKVFTFDRSWTYFPPITDENRDTESVKWLKLYFDVDYTEMGGSHSEFFIYDPTISVQIIAQQVKPGEAPVKTAAEITNKTVEYSFVDLEAWDSFIDVFEKNLATNVYSGFNQASMPAIFQQNQYFENSTVTKLHVCVGGVYNDKIVDNNHVFTVSVVKNDKDSLSGDHNGDGTKGSTQGTALKTSTSADGALVSTHVIKIPKGTIARGSVLDLDVNIQVGAGETLAFGSANDSICMGYIDMSSKDNTIQYYSTNALLRSILRDFPQIAGFSCGDSSSWMNPSELRCDDKTGVLYCPWPMLINVEYQRTYDTSEAYLAAKYEGAEFTEKLDLVKGYYENKYVSVFGDSISTYEAMSNTTRYNSNISNDAEVWYGRGGLHINQIDRYNYQAYYANLYSYQYTYWGSVQRMLNMNLCVNAAWSGAQLCESNSSRAVYTRFTNLHQNTIRGNDGQTDPDGRIDPDLILCYYGINDTWHTTSTKAFASEADKESFYDDTAAWVEDFWNLKQGNEISDWTPAGADGVGDYNSFAQAYTLMLCEMHRKYPNAEIVVYSLLPNNSSDYDNWTNADKSDGRPKQFSDIIKALADSGAEELGNIILVDQEKYIDTDEISRYMADAAKWAELDMNSYDCIHPNVMGHKAIYEGTIEALYSYLKSKTTYNRTYLDPYVLQQTVELYEANPFGVTDDYANDLGPYLPVTYDEFGYSELKSITLPVNKTSLDPEMIDGVGYYSTELYIYPDNLATIYQLTTLTPIRVYKLKIKSSALKTIKSGYTDSTASAMSNVGKMIGFNLLGEVKESSGVKYIEADAFYWNGGTKTTVADAVRVECYEMKYSISGSGNNINNYTHTPTSSVQIDCTNVRIDHGECFALTRASDNSDGRLILGYIPSGAKYETGALGVLYQRYAYHLTGFAEMRQLIHTYNDYPGRMIRQRAIFFDVEYGRLVN